MLTYARIVAVPLVVACMYWQAILQGDLAALGGAGHLHRGRRHRHLDGYLARAWPAVEHRPHARPDRRQAAGVVLPADARRRRAPSRGWSLWAAIIILCREILVSGLREYLAELRVSVPVTRLAKWKTTMQMVAIGFLLAGAGRRQDLPGHHRMTGHRAAAVDRRRIVTLYTGYDYFRAGLQHLMDEDA